MSSKPFLLISLANLHKDLNDAIQDLTPEQLNWRSPNGGNSIAFIIWHFSRTEDNLIQFALQRQPTVWMDQGYDKKFGLDPRAQGTGMPPEEAAKIRLPSSAEVMPYLKSVWQNTEAYLAGLDEAKLTEEIELRGLGKRTYEQILGNTLMTHGFSHLGEIWSVKGLQGMKGSPI
jgi:hypothetical protein